MGARGCQASGVLWKWSEDSLGSWVCLPSSSCSLARGLCPQDPFRPTLAVYRIRGCSLLPPYPLDLIPDRFHTNTEWKMSGLPRRAVSKLWSFYSSGRVFFGLMLSLQGVLSPASPWGRRSRAAELPTHGLGPRAGLQEDALCMSPLTCCFAGLLCLCVQQSLSHKAGS